MSETLEAIYDGHHVGTLSYTKDRLRFAYQHQPRKLKLAMKVGGEYLLWKMNQERWQKAAKEWGFTEDFVIEQIRRMASAIPEAAQTTREEVTQVMGADPEILDRLTIEISQRARTCLAEMSV